MARLRLLLALLLAGGGGGARAQQVQRPRCPSDAPQRCVPHPYFGQNEYHYTVDGLNLKIEFTDSGFFTLTCPKELTLDNEALPRFESQLRVNKAQLLNCPAPRESYGAALATLGVAPLDKLKLSGAGLLTRAQLGGLARLPALELGGARLAPGALAALAALRRLQLDAVRLPPGELLALPRSLEMLQLVRMNTSLPGAALARLPALVNVTVRDSGRVAVQPAGALQGLALEMPAVRLDATLLPSLRRLTVFGWDERRPQPWAACDALEALRLHYAAARALPGGWLQRCPRLRLLHVVDAHDLVELHDESLRGARLLEELRVTSCALASLPVGLLDDAVNLNLLDLSGNRLHELPSGMFAVPRSLQELDLSKNNLTTEVFVSLQSVTSLTKLKLSNNIHLKDSCKGVLLQTVLGWSPLQHLRQLTELHLRNTGASMICGDWRDIMSLKKLDLEQNNFTSIPYADLRFRNPVEVNLRGNNITRLYYTRRDYELVTSKGEEWSGRIQLDERTLACDCDNYWAARALRDRPAHVRLAGAGCAGGGELGEPAALLCGAPALCPRACACATRDAVRAPGRVLRVRCERAALRHVRDALAPVAAALRARGEAPQHYAWQLLLAHNRIADLSAADLPTHLEVLDLSHNNVSRLRAEDAAALLGDARRRVFLAHNPLACDCAAADAVAALRRRRAAIADYDNVTCAGELPLGDAPALPCAPPLGAGARAALAGGALLALLGAAALGALLHPALRLRLKAALHARGWLAAAEPEDERRFDAFVSFSHGDERFVREQLVARLESGPAPYRLCVHYRDWAPGGWIPAQIAASVRASRRTVAVVSAHFLRSAWARAELREAYALALRDARPRLVVVLLDAPERLPLDERLRAYLATNTYLRWGDPWFWQKLRLALPRGRGLAPPAPSAPPAPAPPVCVVVPSPREAASPGPASSDAAVELDRLVKPSCAAQCASDVTPCASLTSNVGVELDILVKPSCATQCASDVTPCALPLHLQL